MIYATETDLERLTDYKSPAKQIQYLTKQKVPFAVSRSGKPLVLIDTLRKMSQRDRAEPDFRAMEMRV